MRPARAILTLALVLLAGGAARAEEACPFPGQKPKLIVQLFFSQSVRRSLAGSGPVSLRSWQRFLAETVTPSLPDGFTVYDAYGQWMDPRTHVISREQTKVVMVADDDSPAFRTRVASVAEAYRKQFDQQSVGLVSQSGCGAF